MVIVHNLTVMIQNKELLTDVSCTLPAGRITTFLGKSGAGKTTLLKAVAQLIPVVNGSVSAHGQQLDLLPPEKRAETIGYVFQEFHLFPHLTVLENCIDPQVVHGTPVEQAKTNAFKILQELDMHPYLHSYPAQLSGGQKQRVAIARALCLAPTILLLDEPTASLDPHNSAILADILQKLAARGLIIGVSSQDMNFVRQIFDRVYYLEAGTIIEQCDTMKTISSCPSIATFMAMTA